MGISRRSRPPGYSPSVVFHHGEKNRVQTFCTLSDGIYHERSVPEMRRMVCLSSSYGWLMLRSYLTNETYLFDPISLKILHLPPILHASYWCAALTCSPTNPNCIASVLNTTKKSLMFCRIGDSQWIEKKLRFKRQKVLSMVGCKGKIYVFCSHEVIVVEFHDSRPWVELHELKDRESTSLGFARYYRSYFLESCGEIFQVVEIHWGLSQNIVTTFEVFKLELLAKVWVRVETLGDRSFLLGTNSVSVSGSGIDKNCIYFCFPGYTSFFRFDMDEGCIRINVPPPKTIPHWDSSYWVVPNCCTGQLKEEAKVTKISDQENSWAQLPSELLELIMSSVILGDCIRFRLASKSWKSITPPLRSTSLLMQTEFSSQQLPWLIVFPKNNKGVFRLHHPVYSDIYTMNSPELADAIIQSAKYGWLLMSKGINSLFFFNPFTMEIVKLPDIEDNYGIAGISFSAPPTSTDYVVFGLVGGEMMIYRKGEKTWYRYWPWDTEDTLEHLVEFINYPCNPVFSDGVFYWLSNGKLGLFNPTAPDESKWKIIAKPALSEYSDRYNMIINTKNKNFIAEYCGDIISISVNILGKPITVYKLDRSKEDWFWSKLENLGDTVLFVSQTGSVFVPAELKGIQNRIYFPRYHQKDIVFYSLSNGSYQCFGGDYCRENWMGTSEYEHCSWIQSSL